MQFRASLIRSSGGKRIVIDLLDDGEPVADLKATGFDSWDSVEEALCDLMMSMDDLEEESVWLDERLPESDDMKVVILQKMAFLFPIHINGAVKINATVTPLADGDVEVCLKSNAPPEETKRILNTLHPEAMQELS